MENVLKIKRISKKFYLLFSFMLFIIPLCYILYWVFINHLPNSLIEINNRSFPLTPHKLSSGLQIFGLVASLFPLLAITYGILNIRKIFSFYKEGVIFSFEHVRLFRNIAKALVFWVFSSMLYESAKSVIFSADNPGGMFLNVGLSSAETAILMVAGIAFVIAWVMDEGRILNEEKELTI